MVKISDKLNKQMDIFYHYSSDKDNKESKLTDEFIELREIIKEIKELEELKKRWLLISQGKVK